MSQRDQSIEALRKAWQADTSRHAGGRDCPADEMIFDAAWGRLETGERRRIVAHLAHCGACAQSWRAAVELQRARPDVTETADWKRPARRQPLNWALAAAAAIAAAIGIVWMLPQIDPGIPPLGDPSALRGDERHAFQLLTPDQASLSADALVLSWESVEGARTYRVRVSDADLETIHAASVETTEVTVPTEALGDIGDGDILYWYVTAELEGGTELRSETGTVVVERTSGKE